MKLPNPLACPGTAPHWPWRNCAVMLTLALGSQAALAVEQGAFEAPSLEGYELKDTQEIDAGKESDDVKETTLEVYANADGNLILKYATKEEVWAWGILGDPQDQERNEKNYVIRDSSGDGTYDEKFFGDESFSLPDHLQE